MVDAPVTFIDPDIFDIHCRNIGGLNMIIAVPSKEMLYFVCRFDGGFVLSSIRADEFKGLILKIEMYPDLIPLSKNG